MTENNIELNPSLKNLKPWKPGQSGNPKGRPSNADIIKRAIRKVMKERLPDYDNVRGWEALVRVIRDCALGGSAKHADILFRAGVPRINDNRQVHLHSDGDGPRILSHLDHNRLIDEGHLTAPIPSRAEEGEI